jgi:hypothetical protein
MTPDRERQQARRRRRRRGRAIYKLELHTLSIAHWLEGAGALGPEQCDHAGLTAALVAHIEKMSQGA